MKVALVIWLILITLLEALMGFFLVVALAMSSMMFTSQEALTDPYNWFLIFCVFGVLVSLVLVLAFQWLFFFFRKPKIAFLISLIPLVVLLFRGPIGRGLEGALLELERARSSSTQEASLGCDLDGCRFIPTTPNVH